MFGQMQNTISSAMETEKKGKTNGSYFCEFHRLWKSSDPVKLLAGTSPTGWSSDGQVRKTTFKTLSSFKLSKPSICILSLSVLSCRIWHTRLFCFLVLLNRPSGPLKSNFCLWMEFLLVFNFFRFHFCVYLLIFFCKIKSIQICLPESLV